MNSHTFYWDIDNESESRKVVKLIKKTSVKKKELFKETVEWGV